MLVAKVCGGALEKQSKVLHLQIRVLGETKKLKLKKAMVKELFNKNKNWQDGCKHERVRCFLTNTELYICYYDWQFAGKFQICSRLYFTRLKCELNRDFLPFHWCLFCDKINGRKKPFNRKRKTLIRGILQRRNKNRISYYYRFAQITLHISGFLNRNWVKKHYTLLLFYTWSATLFRI